MEQHYIDIDGAKLFYIESDATCEQTIFFLHGNSSSHRTWQKQFDSPLLAKYRLIAFDLPAHGLSDGMLGGTDSYTLPAIAKLMAEAVKQIAGSDPYILAGVSLGTNIIVEMIAHGLNPSALVLAGPCIIGKKYAFDKFAIPNTKIGIGFIDEPEEEDIIALINLAVNYPDVEKSKTIFSDFKAVKDKFRSSIGQSVGNGAYSDEFALLKEKKIQVLIIFGADDKAVDSNYLDDAPISLWGNKIIKLKGAGHWVHLDEPILFTKLLAEFASDTFSKVDF